MSGAVTLGLSLSNLITWNGSLNSSIGIGTTNTFDIGSDAFGLASIYLGSGSSAHSTRLKGASVSAAYTFTLPLTSGTSRQVLQTDGTGVTKFVDNPRSSIDIQNAGILTSVSASALTVALKGADGNDPSATNLVDVEFRNSTAGTGTPTLVTVNAALSLTVASTATLGHVSAVANYIYVYALNNAGAVELAVSSAYFDEGTVQSTTALSAGSTSAGVLYSTVSRSNVAIRLLARMKSTQATAGTWATNMSEISLPPFNIVRNSEIYLESANGFGSTNNKIRRFNTVSNNIGNDLTLTQDAANGDSITVNTSGLYSVCVSDRKSGGGMSYGFSVNTSAPTTGIDTLTYAQGRRLHCSPTTATNEGNSRVLRLMSGDVVRHHGDGTADGGVNNTYFIVTRVD